MEKRNFEQAFNAVFHDNDVFHDFCSLDIKSETNGFLVGSRTVYRPSDKLKKYLRFIDKVILKHLQINGRVVHSYVKERSVLTAVKAHESSKYFFLTDIKSFFSNIKKSDVSNILVRNQENVPVTDFKNYIDTIVDYTTFNDSIPVGFPTSPNLSNAFLLGFDIALENYCIDKELIYTRYSDDIIISGHSMHQFDGIDDDIQVLLHEKASKKFVLNSKKTRLTHIGNKVKILGLVITPDGRVTIDSKYKKTLESLIYFYINDKTRYNDLLDKRLRGKEHSFFGLLHYVKSIDQEYLDKLQRKYGAYTLSTLMEDKWSGQR